MKFNATKTHGFNPLPALLLCCWSGCNYQPQYTVSLWNRPVSTLYGRRGGPLLLP